MTKHESKVERALKRAKRRAAAEAKQEPRWVEDEGDGIMFLVLGELPPDDVQDKEEA
jgi:hypothetical protein